MKGEQLFTTNSKEQIEEWKLKAEKWDKLDESIGKCYPDYDEEGNEIQTEIEDVDLGTIGEIAAKAFGYL